jgi:hypothetical protein
MQRKSGYSFIQINYSMLIWHVYGFPYVFKKPLTKSLKNVQNRRFWLLENKSLLLLKDYLRNSCFIVRTTKITDIIRNFFSANKRTRIIAMRF